MIALFAAAFALRVVLISSVFTHFIDDSYIYMRYVDNFLAGRGFVYNEGHPVLGFTSLLYAVMVAAAGWLARGNLVLAIHVINFMLFTLLGYLLFRVLDLSSRFFPALAALLLLHFPFVDATINGMETTLFVAVLLATLFAVKKQQGVVAIGLGAAAVLTRPEGVFLLLPVLVYGLLTLSRPRFLIAISIGAVMAALIALTLYHYYGTVLPHSMLAKSSLITGAGWDGVRSTPFEKTALLAFGMSDHFFFSLPDRVRLMVMVALFTSLIPFILGAWSAWRKRYAYILILSAFFALVAAFYILGNPVRIFSWYVIPTATAFFIVCGFGCDYALSRWPSPKLAAPATALALILVIGSNYHAIPARWRSIENHVVDLQNLTRRITTEWPDAASIMIADIGIVGYDSKCRIIDLAGLVSPESLAHEQGDMISLGSLISQTQPDIILLQTNPLTLDRINESSLSRKSFIDVEARARFENNYAPWPVESGVIRHAFVHRSKVISEASD